jgi:hypothetical protein
MSEQGEKTMPTPEHKLGWKQRIARTIGASLIIGASQVPHNVTDKTSRISSAEAAVPTRIFLPSAFGGRNTEWNGAAKQSVPETPVPVSEIAKWYENEAKEVPGTRFEKVVSGKICILKSVADTDASTVFGWRESYAQSLSDIQNFMSEDQLDKFDKSIGGPDESITGGFDELVLGRFTSIEKMRSKGINNAKELGTGVGTSFRSWGYFGYITFQSQGREVRMAAWAPPTSQTIPAIDMEMRAGTNTALHLVHVSVAGMTTPENVSVEQLNRMKVEQQAYVYGVQLRSR